MISDDTIEKILDWRSKTAIAGPKARAERIYIEEYRKTLKAILMKKAMAATPGMSAVSAEMEAYAHPEYKMHLEALREAVEADEKYRWLQVTADVKIECWRTQQANHRAMEKGQ